MRSPDDECFLFAFFLPVSVTTAHCQVLLLLKPLNFLWSMTDEYTLVSCDLLLCVHILVPLSDGFAKTLCVVHYFLRPMSSTPCLIASTLVNNDRRSPNNRLTTRSCSATANASQLCQCKQEASALAVNKQRRLHHAGRRGQRIRIALL